MTKGKSPRFYDLNIDVLMKYCFTDTCDWLYSTVEPQ